MATQYIGCANKTGQNANTVDQDWGCYKNSGEPRGCGSCNGWSTSTYDASCCLYNYPIHYGDTTGPDWYGGFYSQWQNGIPTDGVSWAKFQLQIKYTWDSGAYDSGWITYPDFSAAGIDVSYNGYYDWMAVNGDSDGADASYCWDNSHDYTSGAPSRNSYRSAGIFTKKDCMKESSKKWFSYSPYDIPVVAVMGDWFFQDQLEGTPGGCLNTVCNNIKGMLPVIRSNEFGYHSPPTWYQGQCFGDASECHEDNLADDAGSEYPRLSSDGSGAIYDITFDSTTLSTSPVKFYMWDPVTDAVYTIGCWHDAISGEYWGSGTTDPEISGAYSIPIIQIEIDMDGEVLSDGTAEALSITGCTDPIACNFNACASAQCSGDNSCCTYSETDSDSFDCGECILPGQTKIFNYYSDVDGDGHPTDSAPTTVCPDNVDYLEELTGTYPAYRQKGRCSHDDDILYGTECTPGATLAGDPYCDSLSAGSTCTDIGFDQFPECDGVDDSCGECDGPSDDFSGNGPSGWAGGIGFWGINEKKYYVDNNTCIADGNVICYGHPCNWMVAGSLYDCSCDPDCAGTKVINACGECDDPSVNNLDVWCYADEDCDGDGGGTIGDDFGKWCCNGDWGYGSHYAYSGDGATACKLDDNDECPGNFSLNSSDGNDTCYGCQNDDSCLDDCGDCISNGAQCVENGNIGNCHMGHDGACYNNLTDIKFYDQCGVLREAMCGGDIGIPINLSIDYPGPPILPGVDTGPNPCNRCGEVLYPNNPYWNSTCLDCAGVPCPSLGETVDAEDHSTKNAVTLFGDPECSSTDQSSVVDDDHCCLVSDWTNNTCGLCPGQELLLVGARRWPDPDGDTMSGYEGAYEGWPLIGWCGEEVNGIYQWSGSNPPVYSGGVVCPDNFGCICGGYTDGTVALCIATDCTADEGLQCTEDQYPNCAQNHQDSCGICCNPADEYDGSPADSGEPDPDGVCGEAPYTMSDILAIPEATRPCGCMNQGCGLSCSGDRRIEYYMDFDEDGQGLTGPYWQCDSTHECECLVTFSGDGGDTNDVDACTNNGYDNYWCCMHTEHCELENEDPCTTANCSTCITKWYVPTLTNIQSCFTMTITPGLVDSATGDFSSSTDMPYLTEWYCNSGDSTGTTYSSMDNCDTDPNCDDGCILRGIDTDNVNFEISVSVETDDFIAHPVFSDEDEADIIISKIYPEDDPCTDDCISYSTTYNIITGGNSAVVSYSIYDNLSTDNSAHGDYLVEIKYPKDCTDDCIINKMTTFSIVVPTVGCTDSTSQCNYDETYDYTCPGTTNGRPACCRYVTTYYSDDDGDGLGCCDDSSEFCPNTFDTDIYTGYSGQCDTQLCIDNNLALPSTDMDVDDPLEGDYPIYGEHKGSHDKYCHQLGYTATNISSGDDVTSVENDSLECQMWDTDTSGWVLQSIEFCEFVIEVANCKMYPWVPLVTEDCYADPSSDITSTDCDCNYNNYDQGGVCMDPMCTANSEFDDADQIFGLMGSAYTVNPSNGIWYTEEDICDASTEVINNPNWGLSSTGCSDAYATNYSSFATNLCKGIGGDGTIGSYNRLLDIGVICFGHCSDHTNMSCEFDTDCVWKGISAGTCVYEDPGTGNQGYDCCCQTPYGCVDPQSPNFNKDFTEDCAGTEVTSCMFSESQEGPLLSGPVSGTEITISLESISGISPMDHLKIDSEVVLIININSTTNSPSIGITRGMFNTTPTSHGPDSSVLVEKGNCKYYCCEPYVEYACTDPNAKNYYCFGDGNRRNDITKCDDFVIPTYVDDEFSGGGGRNKSVIACTSDLFGPGWTDQANSFPTTNGSCGKHYFSRTEEESNPDWIKTNGIITNFQAQTIGQNPSNYKITADNSAMWMLNPAMMDNVYGPGTWKVEVQYINDSPIKGINKALKITVDSFDTTTYRQGYGGGPVIMSGTPNFNTMTNGYFRAIVKVVTGKINLGFCGDNGDNCIVQDATYGWKEIHNADGLFTDTVDSTFYLSPDVRDGGSAEIWILEYGLYENINPGSGNDCCCEYEYDCEGNKILSTDYNAYTDSCTDPDGPCAYYDECGVCSNGYQSLNDPYYDYSTGISGGDLSFGGDNLGCGCFRGSPPIWHQNRDFDDQACNCQSETCIYFDREWVCTDGTNINSTYDTQALCQVDVDGGTCNTCAFQPIDTTDYGYGKSWKYCLPDQFPSFGDSLPWDDNNVNPIYPFGYFPVKATIPIYDQSECIGGTIDICGVCDGDNSYCGYPTPAEIDDLGVMPVCSGNIWHDCNIMSYINEATCQTATSGNPACYCFQRPYTDCTYDAWTGNWVSTCDWPITTVSAQYQVIFFNIPETGAPDDFWRCGGACLFDVLDGLEFNSQYVLYDSNQNTILTTNLSNTWVPPTGNGGQYIQMQIGQSISPITFQFGTTGQYDTLGGLFSFAVAMTSGGWDEVISNFDPLTPTDTICGEAPCSYCPGYLLDTDTDGNTDIIGSGNCLESGRCESATMTYLESGTSCGCAYDATDCLNHCVNPNTMPEGLNFDLAAANWGWDDCDVCYGGSADGSYISNYNDENPTCNFDPDCWDQVLNEDGLIIDVTWVGTVGNKCPSNSHYDCHCSCPASFEAAAGLYSLGGNYSGAAFIDDCGSCVAGLTYMPVRWNKDSCGNCNGTSWILPIIDPFGSSTFTADGSGGIRYPHAVTNINKIKITDATQIFYPTKINNKLYTESSEILQDFSYCDEERRILTNATSGGDLNIWANELQLHINKNGGTNNYKPCFSRTSSTNHACGDLNDDGVINILDVILLLNLVLSGSYDPCADLNGDGNLNILDMVRIINCIVGSNDCEFTNCECGVCPGETDECGVCMGDNSSCADCAGVPNGGAVEDECGVCDGDGSSCADDDCAGVPGGDAVVDECGVCDGDNSSCADCAGVTNGDAEEDCNGVCDGGAEECMESGVCCESPAVCCPQTGQCCSSGDCDLCGVCDGDDTGYLCPYSGSVVCNEDMCQTSFCTSGDSDGSVYEDIAACEADLGCTSCNYYIPGWEITDPINVDSGTCNGSLITPGNHMYLCLVDGNVYSHTQACDTSYGVAACCGGTSGGGGCRACVYLGDKGVQHTGVNLGDWAECTGLACDSCTGTPNGYMCNYGFANSTLGCDCACGAGWENDDCDVCGGDGTLCRGCKSDDAAVLNCQDHYFLCPSGCAAPIQTIFDEDGDGSLDDEADYFKTQYLWCDGNAVSCANAEWKTCDPPDGKAGCTKKWKDDGMGGAYLHSEHDTWGHDSDVGCVGFKDFSARYPDDPLSCLYDIECTSIFGPRYKDKYCEPPGGWWDSAVTTSHNSWYSSINLSPVEWGTSSYNINSQITYNQLVTNPVDDDIEEAIWGYSDATVGEEFTYSQCINFVNTCSEDYNQPWGGGYEPACCTQFFCGIDLYNQSISPYDIYTLQEEAADLDIDYGFCGVPGPNGRGSLENLNYSGYQFHNMGMWGWSASDSIPMSRNKEEPAWRCQNDNDCYQYGVDAPDETALNPYTKCIKHRDRYNFYKCTPGDILYNWDNGELPYGPDSVGGECFVYTDSRYGTDYVDASGNKGTGYGEDDGDSTDSAVMTCEDGNCPDGQYPIDEVEWMIGHGKPRNLGYFSSISECKLDAPDIYNTDASDHDPLCQRACRANMYLWDPPRWTCTGGEEEGTTYWDEEQCLGSVKVECKGVYCPNQACNPSETMWNSNETYCVRTDDSDCPSSSEEYSRCKYASNNCSAGAANCYQDPGDFCNRFIYPGGVCCDYDELWNTDCDVRCGVCDVNTAACPPAPACENTNFTDTSACTDTSDPSTAEDSYGYACTSGSDSYQDCVQSYLDDGNSEYDSRNWCGCFNDDYNITCGTVITWTCVGIDNDNVDSYGDNCATNCATCCYDGDYDYYWDYDCNDGEGCEVWTGFDEVAQCCQCDDGQMSSGTWTLSETTDPDCIGDFVAAEMCCACGGGSSTGDIEEHFDSDGKSCEYYTNHPEYCPDCTQTYPPSCTDADDDNGDGYPDGFWDDGDFIVAKMCCACGGGYGGPQPADYIQDSGCNCSCNDFCGGPTDPHECSSSVEGTEGQCLPDPSTDWMYTVCGNENLDVHENGYNFVSQIPDIGYPYTPPGGNPITITSEEQRLTFAMQLCDYEGCGGPFIEHRAHPTDNWDVESRLAQAGMYQQGGSNDTSDVTGMYYEEGCSSNPISEGYQKNQSSQCVQSGCTSCDYITKNQYNYGNYGSWGDLAAFYNANIPGDDSIPFDPGAGYLYGSDPNNQPALFAPSRGNTADDIDNLICCTHIDGCYNYKCAINGNDNAWATGFATLLECEDYCFPGGVCYPHGSNIYGEHDGGVILSWPPGWPPAEYGECLCERKIVVPYNWTKNQQEGTSGDGNHCRVFDDSWWETEGQYYAPTQKIGPPEVLDSNLSGGGFHCHGRVHSARGIDVIHDTHTHPELDPTSDGDIEFHQSGWWGWSHLPYTIEDGHQWTWGCSYWNIVYHDSNQDNKTDDDFTCSPYSTNSWLMDCVTDPVWSDLSWAADLYGCTDSMAVYTDLYALLPCCTSCDGSDDNDCCEYIHGCIDPWANNYWPAATKDDGSCTYNWGCIDEIAENYDESVNTDYCTDDGDGSLYGMCHIFNREWTCINGTNINNTYDTQPLCQVDIDSGECTECRYQPIDSLVCEDNQLCDNSCEYIYGCMDEAACTIGTSDDCADICNEVPGACYGDECSCYNPDATKEEGCAYPCGEGEIRLWGTCYNIATTTKIVIEDTIVGYAETLTAEIPPIICEFPNLREIRLRENDFFGKIPGCICANNNLEYLDLSGNRLSGKIPDSCWTHPQIETFLISGNGFTGEIPDIIDLPKIENFQIQSNNFYGVVPESICSVVDAIAIDKVFTPNTNKQMFSMYNNWFCPSDPTTWPECIRRPNVMDSGYCGSENNNEYPAIDDNECICLGHIYQQHTNEFDASENVLDNPDYQSIDIWDRDSANCGSCDCGTDQYDSTDHPSLSGLVSVDGMDLHVCGNGFDQGTGLTTLDLSSRSLTNDDIDNLAGSLNHFTSDLAPLPTGIINLVYLTHLDLSDNLFTGSVPEFVKYAGGPAMNEPSNRSINCNWCDNTAVPFKFVPNTIRNLDLSYNGFDTTVPDYFGDTALFTGLKTLNLSNNDFIGKLPDNICNVGAGYGQNQCPDHLDIRENHLCPTFWEQVEYWPICMRDGIGEGGPCIGNQPKLPDQCCDGFISNCTPEFGDSCCLTRFVADGGCDGADQPYGCDLRCYDCAVKECNGWPCPIEDYPDNCVDGDGNILPLCGNPLIDQCIEAVYNDDWNPNEAQAGDGGDCECTPMTLADCLHWIPPRLCGEWPDGCGGVVDCEDHCGELDLYCFEEFGTCACNQNPQTGDPELCCPGQVANCNPDYVNADPEVITWACAPIMYIGGEYCDNSCQPYGWDLTCYDCAERDSESGLCIKEMASTDPANEDGGACKTCGYEESWCNANHWCGTWANSECGCWDCGDCIDEDAGLPCGEDQKCCDDSHTDIDRCCNNRVQNCNTSALLKCCPDEYLGNYTCDDSTMPFGCDLTCYEAEAGPDHSYDCLCPDDCDDPNDGTWCGDWTDDCGTEHSCVGNCIAGTICETYICISCEPLDCGVMCGEIYDECAQDTVFCGDCSFGQECEDNWCTTCNDHVEDCCDGYIPNCDPTYDNPQLITTKICCDETWIGDGNCDGIDQYRGCDLTCYDNGGSECGDPQGDCSDGGDCYCGCVAGESYGPGCDVIYTSDGCDLWADVTDDGWADEWVDNCLVCSECITSYDYDWANMLCCDEMFWNSSFWSDPCDDTSPRLTCTIIGMMWPEIDCSGCACPCWPPGTGYCVSGICSVSGAVC